MIGIRDLRTVGAGADFSVAPSSQVAASVCCQVSQVKDHQDCDDAKAEGTVRVTRFNANIVSVREIGVVANGGKNCQIQPTHDINVEIKLTRVFMVTKLFSDWACQQHQNQVYGCNRQIEQGAGR